MTAGITIPAGELSAIMQKAIVDSLSPETKNTMIQGAIAKLMEKPAVDNYSSKKGDSMLETAFIKALREVAHDVAKEVVEEVRPQIALQLRPMVEAIGGEYDWDLARALMQTMLEWAVKHKKIQDSY